MSSSAHHGNGKLLVGDPADLPRFADGIAQVRNALPQRVSLEPDKVERGLAKLVLTLIELLRQLMERQALRRIEAGSLTDDEIERLGETFLKLDERMLELCTFFDLDPEDLNLNLGPLGNLL
jgi:hypothetical protein